MSINSPLSLAALVGSRICHDLISPVGAINNGIELISMGGPIETPELCLISDSVQDASARIKFFRVAFGMASEAQLLGTPEVTNIVNGVYAEGRHTARWLATGDIPRAQVQAVFLAMLCAESALPVGGEIRVEKDGGKWRVSGKGRRTCPEPDLWRPLGEGHAPAQLTPAHVQFGLLPHCLSEMGREPRIVTTPDTVSIAF